MSKKIFHAKGRARNFPKIHFVTIMLSFLFFRKTSCDQQPKSVAWGGKEKDSLKVPKKFLKAVLGTF
jgi:hypothetical protein